MDRTVATGLAALLGLALIPTPSGLVRPARAQDPTPVVVAPTPDPAPPGAVAPAPPAGPVRAYHLSIESELQLKLRDQPQLIEAVTTVEYDVAARPGAEEVAVHSLGVTIRDASRVLTQSSLSRAGAKLQQGGQPSTLIEARNAPEALKARLDEFDSPMATIAVDADGRETGRTVLLKPDSPLLSAGMIDTTRLFHVPFPRAATEWESPVAVSLGSGQHARGTLRYERLGTAPGADGTVRVKVTGELRAEGSLGIGELRNASYRVTGEQVYDPAVGAWASGRLNLDVSFELYSAGQPIGTGSGPILISLVLLKDRADDRPADRPAP